MASLLAHGKVKMIGLYSKKKSVCYDATIMMDDNGEKYVNFKLEFEQRKEGNGFKRKWPYLAIYGKLFLWMSRKNEIVWYRNKNNILLEYRIVRTI